MPQINGPISAADMAALQPCPLWSDGRKGYVWCRFDVLLCPETRLRAELTWDDDGDFEDNETGEPTVYFDANLFIETNRPEMPTQEFSLVTWDGIGINLSREEAIALAMGDPRDILTKYASQIANLAVWKPEDGYSDYKSPLGQRR